MKLKKLNHPSRYVFGYRLKIKDRNLEIFTKISPHFWQLKTSKITSLQNSN